MIYTTRDNQTLFDVANVLYGNLNRVMELAQKNGLSINQPLAAGVQIQYDGSVSNGYDYSTGFGLFETYEPISITTQPVDQSICGGLSDAVFFITTTGEVASYQWQYSGDGFSWFNVTPASYYIGIDTESLIVTSDVPDTFTGFHYRCKVVGMDGSVLYSDDAVITIAENVVMTIPSTISEPEWTGFGIAATSPVPMSAQWQYSDDGGTTWNNLVDSAHYPSAVSPLLSAVIGGVNTDTLGINNLHRDMDGWKLRIRCTPGCDGGYSYSNVCDVTVERYHVAVEDYHDAIYIQGETWTNSELNAINRLVNDLNGVPNGSYTTVNIWNRFRLIYPLLNSNPNIAKLNLVNSMSGTYDLTFNSVLHNANGTITFAGSTGSFANTHYAPGIAGLPATNCHMSAYSIDDIDIPTPTVGGCPTSDSNLTTGTTNITRVTTTVSGSINAATVQSINPASSKSLLLVSRQNETETLTQARTTQSYSPTLVTAKPQQSTNTFTIGKVDTQVGAYSCAFFTVGLGINKIEALAYYDAVQNYQTSLGRAV